jgi:hypothetical protein
MAKVRGRDFVVRNLREYPTRWRAVARRVMEDEAAIVEERMKAEHRWQNVSGDAERALRCRVFDNGQVLRLQATHGVPYGVFLEHAHQGRFAVLQPTVRTQWPKTLKRVAAEVKRSKAG